VHGKYIQYSELLDRIVKKDYKDGDQFCDVLSQNMPENLVEFLAMK
jgi:hypothetical protein